MGNTRTTNEWGQTQDQNLVPRQDLVRAASSLHMSIVALTKRIPHYPLNFGPLVISVSLSLLSCGCLTSSTRCFHPGGAAASKPSKQTASSQSPSSSSSPRHRLWISLCVSLFNFLHPREPLCNLHNYRPITSYSVICLNTMSAGELTLQRAQLYCMLVGFS